MPKTCTSKENSWIGLASYAWSGYVVRVHLHSDTVRHKTFDVH